MTLHVVLIVYAHKSSRRIRFIFTKDSDMYIYIYITHDIVAIIKHRSLELVLVKAVVFWPGPPITNMA